MPLRLKTKFTLTTALLVLAVAAVISAAYTATLTRQVIAQTRDSARQFSQQVFLQAQQALNVAADQGQSPASDSPEDLREFVRKTLDENAGLSSQIEAAVGFSPTIYEVTMVDRAGTALISSDSSIIGRPMERRTNLEVLVNGSFLEQLRALFGPQSVYEYVLPFKLGSEPFGEVRIGINTALLRHEISPRLNSAGLLALGAVVISTLLAAATSHVTLAPLTRISEQLDRISREAAASSLGAPAATAQPARGHEDELGQVSSKINRIGEQIRSVREIFGTLRENMNQVMAGMDDGLLLFGADGRNVLASPAVEKFLGVKPESLLGMSAQEVFPPAHPVGRALQFEGEQLAGAEAAEVTLDGVSRVKRAAVNVQLIGGSDAPEKRPLGALLTLRDLDSIERIGSQLEISERLAALGRVTAGVAHEVKNPLNSMRLWIENLKENLPAGEEEPRKAVKILDNEIDRLDRVVRTFLDFTRPVELKLEETSLAELCAEVVALAQPQIRKAQVEVAQEIEAGLPPTLADRALLQQALLNLVLNACEAMNGGGRLTLSLLRKGEMGEIAVADTGCGIPPELHGKIFQLYFTTRPGGSGIGLATTYRIVQLHNGSIDFSSETGRGTTFRIELPLARGRVVEPREVNR